MGGVISFNKGVQIASNSVVSATDGGRLSFGKMVGINRNSMIMCHDSIRIGANTVILRGTTIGDNCLIAAGCVVKGNVPAGSVVIQKREEIIKQK